MRTISADTGAANGSWMYVLEWLSENEVWVAYDMAPSLRELRASIFELERLGYVAGRRRVRHWFSQDG